MKPLERDICRLLCECGLAAANHGLAAHAETIRAALPHLVSAPTDRRILEATLLIGLAQTHEAMKLLSHDTSLEASTLRQLIESSRSTRLASPTQPYSPALFG
ncbi:EscG/YscG/SsaH family type III secretion system needle protein co-chaperone [Pseudomonas chlororaphis]|uniref:EscG/YscG/SsaH family type III secretion system needle protein co-chaperone n=1 Tax=Pseudomonas chlororaphis TaxID=587753 RepID=UPI00068ADCED|nr:EscG/YscG/SsaH family type III secretion system needle protein co-chaperone [Pseudomonas chlororaphis]